MKVIKRDGNIVEYNPEKIKTAIKKANEEVSRRDRANEKEIQEIIDYVEDLKKSRILVEDIQDIIEPYLNICNDLKEEVIYEYKLIPELFL